MHAVSPLCSRRAAAHHMKGSCAIAEPSSAVSQRSKEVTDRKLGRQGTNVPDVSTVAELLARGVVPCRASSHGGVFESGGYRPVPPRTIDACGLRWAPKHGRGGEP